MIKTAECVSPGHPDKMCDRISDAILDAYLTQDPTSRVAIESVGSHGEVWVTGEVTFRATGIDIPAIVTKIAGPGLAIRTHVVAQSPENSVVPLLPERQLSEAPAYCRGFSFVS